jgi:hypothetical protein
MSALRCIAAVALLLTFSGAQGGRVALHRAVCPLCTNCAFCVTAHVLLLDTRSPVEPLANSLHCSSSLSAVQTIELLCVECLQARRRALTAFGEISRQQLECSTLLLQPA